MNEFGELNMGNPSVQFDEGRERAGHWLLAFQPSSSCLLYETEPAPVKLVSTWVKVPPVELDCSRRNMNSTASPQGGVGS